MALGPTSLIVWLPLLLMGVTIASFVIPSVTAKKKLSNKGRYKKLMRLQQKHLKLQNSNKKQDKAEKVRAKIVKLANKLEDKGYHRGEMQAIKDKYSLHNIGNEKRSKTTQENLENKKSAKDNKKDDANKSNRYTLYSNKTKNTYKVKDMIDDFDLLEVNSSSKSMQQNAAKIAKNINQKKVNVNKAPYKLTLRFGENGETKTESIESVDKNIFKALKDSFLSDLSKRINFKDSKENIVAIFSKDFKNNKNRVKTESEFRKLNQFLDSEVSTQEEQKKNQSNSNKEQKQHSL